MVGAGAIVTEDVPDFGLVYGGPARLKGFVCKCGKVLNSEKIVKENNSCIFLTCRDCEESISIPKKAYRKVMK